MSRMALRASPQPPTMIVGKSMVGETPPLGLGEPFRLGGGDRLTPAGIPHAIIHDHQPALREAVAAACQACIENERGWFRTSLVLVGKDTGRRHAARFLAQVARVPHVRLDNDQLARCAAAGEISPRSDAQWVSPVATAMAAARCANPIVSVPEADALSPESLAALKLMAGPSAGQVWPELRLRTFVDLSEVSWVLQVSDPSKLPPELLGGAYVVEMDDLWHAGDTLRTSVTLEVLHDLDRKPEPAHLTGHRTSRGVPSPAQLYQDIRSALKDDTPLLGPSSAQQ